jgi:sugar phosphate isomerase/epimerase
MKFGIMSMQAPDLLPKSTTMDGAMQALNRFDLSPLVEKLHREGFDPIEIGGDLSLFFPQVFSTAGIQRLADLQDSDGTSYTVHLPLWSVEPSTPIEGIREASVGTLVSIVQATLPLHPRSYVLHATGPLAAEFYEMPFPEDVRPLALRLFQQNARRSIATILEKTGIPSRLLAIETIEFPFELTLELAEQMDLSMCLDTGHVLAGFSGPVNLFDALEQMLPRLGEIHLHDSPWQGPQHIRQHGKDHSKLGTGDLDVGRLFDRLQTSGYDGPIIFELTLDEARDSLATIRSLRPGLA